MSNQHNSLYNEDLAPVPMDKRNWNMWNIAALWVGMAVCIPSYMLAASLMKEGMYWWQALFTIALANTIVLVPMILNAHAGTKYGIPFPVLLRASFGVRGANIPAIMRALVACGWFGIQTWIGGAAIHSLLLTTLKLLNIELGDSAPLPLLDITLLQFICFMLFWAINMYVIIRGIDCIKWMENWSAPFLIAVGLALLYWGVSTAGGFGVIFAEETVSKIRGTTGEYNFWKVFFPQLTGMIAFWATLSLNIPDFTRYARSQRDQVLGQLISLPTTMTLFSFIGITVTAASVVIFGEAVWDPVVLLAKFESPVVVIISLVSLLVATLSTNIAANVVSPANDFSNLRPDKISFRTGGIITGILGIVIMPWKLVNDLNAYIFTWLIGYGALLGSIAGVMLFDYYFVRRTDLNVEALYQEKGQYSFNNGTNWSAVAALILGILPNVPGFLHAASNGSIAVPEFFVSLYTYAWFVSVLVAGISYLILQSLTAKAENPASPVGLGEES